MNASCTRASTFSRVPSSPGCTAPSSSRARSTRPLAARPLPQGLRAAELEPRELYPPLRAHRQEAEVGEEVRGEDRLVDVEPLEVRLAFGVAVGERLERAGSPLARVSDRGEEERLHHPRPRRIGEVGTRHEHGVVARRPRGELTSTREELGRAVLHRPEQVAVVVVVDRPPRAPLVFGVTNPLALVRAAPVARLPPDALVADARRRLDRRTGQPGDPRRHNRSGPTASTTTSTTAGSLSPILRRSSRSRSWTSLPTAGIDVPHSVTRCSSIRTAPFSPDTRTACFRGSGLSASPRTPSTSHAASAA